MTTPSPQNNSLGHSLLRTGYLASTREVTILLGLPPHPRWTGANIPSCIPLTRRRWPPLTLLITLLAILAHEHKCPRPVNASLFRNSPSFLTPTWTLGLAKVCLYRLLREHICKTLRLPSPRLPPPRPPLTLLTAVLNRPPVLAIQTTCSVLLPPNLLVTTR